MRSLEGPRLVARWMTVAIVVLGCLATWPTVGAQNGQLKLVSTAWPPFTNPPKQPRFALDLVEAALGRIGVTAKTAIVSAPQYTPPLLCRSSSGSTRSCAA